MEEIIFPINQGRYCGFTTYFLRYKWSKELLQKYVVPHVGEQALAPNYFTPPYLTAQPDVIHYRLTPRDRFLILATDGLWDLLSPLQAVRLVGKSE